jgi:starvation-inducible DNA-binding protein
MDPGHQINCFNRRVMAQTVLRVLAETGMLAMKTQSVWWSLQGPALAFLDTTLEGQRQDLLNAMTPLARRMTALGYCIVIDNATLMAHARAVGPQPKHVPVREMVRQLSQDHQAVAVVVRYARLLATDLDDGATLCLLDRRLLAHESAASRLEDLALSLDNEHRLLRLEGALDEILDPAG